MHKLFCSICILITVGVFGFSSATTAADPTLEKEPRNELKRLFEALASGDPARVEPWLAPEFQLVRADGSAYNKAEYLNGREAQSGSAQPFVFRIQPDGWNVVASANLARPLTGTSEIIPSPDTLERILGISPVSVKFFEPHLATVTSTTKIEYLGWAVGAVFDHILGRNWKQKNADIEFRALDGYVSRIPIAKFLQHKAYLVVGIQGGKTFTVDNLAQNERGVPLGPYYLVWDNIASAQLVEDGASDWPYQVISLGLSSSRQAALLPGNMSPDYSNKADLTTKHCLTCHRANGYGGDKWPIDLTLAIRKMDVPHRRLNESDKPVKIPGVNIGA